jgi:hypothetical protein
MLCTFRLLSQWCCPHCPSLAIRMYMLGMSPRIDSVSLLWRVAYSLSSNNSDDRCSKHSTLMYSIPVQITKLPCRGEWDPWTIHWFNITPLTVVSLFRACVPPKLITNIAEIVRHFHVQITKLDEWGRKCDIGRWAIHLRDIDLTETSCKSSWLLGYMPCISDPERC